MTIIAYREGIMCADTAVWRGDCISGFVKKIVRLPEGGLAAASGDSAVTEWFLRRMEADGDLSKPPGDPDDNGFGAIIVRSNGDVSHVNISMIMIPVQADWHALGRSSGFLCGALSAGATAEQAVRLALKWTDAGAGDLQVERLR